MRRPPLGGLLAQPRSPPCDPHWLRESEVCCLGPAARAGAVAGPVAKGLDKPTRPQATNSRNRYQRSDRAFWDPCGWDRQDNGLGKELLDLDIHPPPVR